MKAKYIVLLCLVLHGINSFGHEQVVHQAITRHAVDSVSQDPSFANFFSVIASDDRTLIRAKTFMVLGSYDEDFGPDNEKLGGYRSLNHFYDPLDNSFGKGLSDAPPDHRSLKGKNSFVWGSISNCAGIDISIPWNKSKKNIWSWQNARGYVKGS